MYRQSGQATVEWVALLLLAALILGAAAVHSSADDDRGLGRLVAKRIASAPRELSLERGGPVSPGGSSGGSAPAVGALPRAPAPAAGAPPRARAPAAPAPPSRAPSGDAHRRLRGVARVAERAWIVCLGYRRLRQELEHPLAPTQTLPLGDALDIANECFNPFSFLFEG